MGLATRERLAARRALRPSGGGVPARRADAAAHGRGLVAPILGMPAVEPPAPTETGQVFLCHGVAFMARRMRARCLRWRRVRASVRMPGLKWRRAYRGGRF